MKRDPRLAEIQLLTFLDPREFAVLSPNADPEKYGLLTKEFKDLIFGLIVDGCFTSDPMITTGGIPPADLVWRSAQRIFRELKDDQQFTVSITHAGRLRLWRLRDELQRRRIREKFGILIDGRHFDEDLQIRLWMMQEQDTVTVMMADLDNFKDVNDRSGSHSRGDEALRIYFTIARGIASAYKGEAYRYGGDEILIVLPGLSDADGLKAAQQLCAAVETEFKTFDKDLPNPPTSSIGVQTFIRSSSPPPAAIRELVDKLMYKAKKGGKNRVETGPL